MELCSLPIGWHVLQSVFDRFLKIRRLVVLLDEVDEVGVFRKRAG
jgi:hypothetical protein